MAFRIRRRIRREGGGSWKLLVYPVYSCRDLMSRRVARALTSRAAPCILHSCLALFLFSHILRSYRTVSFSSPESSRSGRRHRSTENHHRCARRHCRRRRHHYLPFLVSLARRGYQSLPATRDTKRVKLHQQ